MCTKCGIFGHYGKNCRTGNWGQRDQSKPNNNQKKTTSKVASVKTDDAQEAQEPLN